MRLFCFIFIFISTVTVAEESLTASDYYEQALQHFAKNEHAHSEMELLKAIGIKPGHLPSRILMAEVYLHLKKPLKSIRHLELALDNGGDKAVVLPMIAEAKVMLGQNKAAMNVLMKDSYEKTTRYYHSLGRIYIAGKEYIKAEQVLMNGISLSTGNKDGLLLGLGEVYFAQQRYVELESTLSKILQKSNDYNKARILLAQSYYKTGKLSESYELYNNLYSLKEKSMAVVYGYVNILIASRNEEKAKSIIESELKLHRGDIYLMMLYATLVTSKEQESIDKETISFITDLEYKLSMFSVTPDNERHIFKLKGVAAFLKRDYRTAKKYLKMYVEYDLEEKGEAEVSLLLSNIYFKENRFERARTYVRYAFDKQPMDFRTVILYSKIERELGNYEPSLQLLKGAYQRLPNNAEIKNALIIELIKQKEHSAALLLVPDLKDNKLTPETWLSIGYLQLETNQIKETLKIADYLASHYGLSPVIAQLLGEISLRIGKEDDALTFFVTASDKASNFKPPLLSLAGMHLNNNEYNKAIKYYDKVLNIDPSDTLALQLSADAYLKLNDADKAINRLEKVSELLPNDVDANRPLLELYMQKKKYVLASTLLRRLMSITKIDQQLLYTKVILNKAQGKLESAKEILNVLYGLNYNNAIELLHIANIYSNINANIELVKTIDRLKDFNSFEVEIAILEAKYNRNIGNYPDALIFINNALSTTSNRQVQLLKAMILLEMKNNNDFIVYLEEIDDGNDESVFKLLLQGYDSLKDNKKKIALLERWAENHPTSIGYIALLALEYEAHSIEKAIALYKQTLAKMPVAEFAFRLAKLIEADSLAYSKKALELEPGNHVYMDGYGWVLIKQGDFRAGLGYIREALARQRGASLYVYHAAFALYKLDRYEEAISLLNNIDIEKSEKTIKNQVIELLEKLNKII